MRQNPEVFGCLNDCTNAVMIVVADGDGVGFVVASDSEYFRSKRIQYVLSFLLAGC